MSSIQNAIDRAKGYAMAGAEITFIEGPRTVDELAMIPRILHVPQVVNMVEGGKTPILPAEQLEEMGF